MKKHILIILILLSLFVDSCSNKESKDEVCTKSPSTICVEYRIHTSHRVGFGYIDQESSWISGIIKGGWRKSLEYKKGDNLLFTIQSLDIESDAVCEVWVDGKKISSIAMTKKQSYLKCYKSS